MLGQEYDHYLKYLMIVYFSIQQFAHARLHGGIQQWEGRVEVRKRTTWATLCDKDLDIYTANVICRSLGYGTAKHYALGTAYAHAMEFMVCLIFHVSSSIFKNRIFLNSNSPTSFAPVLVSLRIGLKLGFFQCSIIVVSCIPICLMDKLLYFCCRISTRQ